MKSHSVQELPIDEMLLKTVKSKTVDLPVTKHLVLRVTPQDWANGEIILFESLCITATGKDLLQKSIETIFK